MPPWIGKFRCQWSFVYLVGVVVWLNATTETDRLGEAKGVAGLNGKIGEEAGKTPLN